MKDKAKAKLISQYLKHHYKQEDSQSHADKAANLRKAIEEQEPCETPTTTKKKWPIGSSRLRTLPHVSKQKRH